MTISKELLKAYQKYRNETCMPHYKNTAIAALRQARFDLSVKDWLAGIGASAPLYTDNSIAHEFVENGFKYVLKIESDENFFYSDVFPYKGGMNSQGYSVKHTRGRSIDTEDNKRYKNGDGMTIYIDVGDRDTCIYKMELPESFIRQFYDNRHYCKAAAHDNMVASARLAIEQDIKCANAEYYYISCTVYNSEGAEIASEGIGGIDSDYALNGHAFYEYGMLDTCRDAVQKELASLALDIEETRPDLYMLPAIAENARAGI